MNKPILYKELIEIIENQSEVIKSKDEVIARLVNENAEKENMINVLMSEFSGT